VATCTSEVVVNAMTNFELRRLMAAASANQEDADLWRMFSSLYDERRIRWCDSARGWLVSIDNRHLATEASFDQAIRFAIARFLKVRTGTRSASARGSLT
jgi:hypothetical protein